MFSKILSKTTLSHYSSGMAFYLEVHKHTYTGKYQQKEDFIR